MTVEVGGVVVLIPKLVDDLDDTVHALTQPDRDLSRAAPVGGSAQRDYPTVHLDGDRLRIDPQRSAQDLVPDLLADRIVAAKVNPQ